MDNSFVSIRKALPADASVIAAFNCAMALETEGKVLIAQRVGAGVARLLADPSLGFYVVAERQGKPVACLMVTNEWSDWRNGLFWWIQSVFVEADWRRRGVYRRLYQFVRDLSEAEPGVCGFRLYVERTNPLAQEVYKKLGMDESHYLMFEDYQM